MVARLESCLPALPRLTTRVLRLRAGIGAADPLSRAQVARRLDRPARAVGRIERRGLKRLRRAVRSGKCEPATSPGQASGGAGASGAAGSAGGATIDAGGAFGADGASGSEGTAGEGMAGSGGQIESRVGVKGESEDSLGPFAGIPGPRDAMNVTVPLLLSLLGLAIFGAWRLRRGQADQQAPD